MLRLPDSWVWDFWTADDGERFHLFFLFASRALHDPDARHLRASVGHAVSDDLRTWTRVADALVPSDGPAFDDRAIWTGSVVPAPDGSWRMFYTGISRADERPVQRIGVATSTDLFTWHRETEPVTRADPRWYETLGESPFDDETWRDPFVFADAGGSGWHMLVTARALDGPVDERGVIGHAWSPDLATWTVRPPLIAGGQGFNQLEVAQSVQVAGRSVLIFSCLAPEMAASRRAGSSGGVWLAVGSSPLGGWDVSGALQLTGPELYCGRLVQDRAGDWQLMAFSNVVDGRFVGEIGDPVPLHGPTART